MTFLKKWIIYFIVDGFVISVCVCLFGLYGFDIAWFLGLSAATLIAAYQTSNNITSEFQKKQQLAEKEKEQAQREKEQAQVKTQIWKASLIEKSKGFPTLLQAIAQYDTVQDEKVENYLRNKSHPSKKGAEVVKEEAHRRRKAEYENKRTQSIIEYYESIAPFLIDFKDEIIDSGDEEKYREYDEEERLDPATQYLAKEEFRALPSVERNQKALDRFWARPKPKWLLGKIYERYIGYMYEMAGYAVDYVGIFQGYEDLGRDLICQKGNDFIVIQCKNWSQFKTIHEKHIFQFFGTVFQYRDSNPGRNVRAIFCTTTKLSDLARRFSNELGIELKENLKFEKTYPSIKCNISQVNGTKIYHLPFDQQYDTCKIEKEKSEFYCSTVKEAEEKGFRRAYRYKGIGKAL